jgi:hypothetical protein
MNSSDIITAVSSNLNRSDITRPQILQWMNDRALQVQNLQNFWFMEQSFSVPTVAGQKTYSLPTGYKDELQIWILQGTTVKLPVIKWVGSEAENSFTNPLQQARPTNYWIWAQEYNFYPIPDQVYTMELKGYFYIDPFTDVASEENDLGKYWSDLIKYGATAEGFHYLSQGTSGQPTDEEIKWQAKYDKEIARLVRRESNRKYTAYTPRLRLRIR